MSVLTYQLLNVSEFSEAVVKCTGVPDFVLVISV